MKRMFILSLSTMSSLLLFTSCEKEEMEVECLTVETVDATLLWSGDYALDGCGFILQVGEAAYKPTNEKEIPASYKTTSSTRVEAKIINNNITVKTCRPATEMNSIEIVSLVKK